MARQEADTTLTSISNRCYRSASTNFVDDANSNTPADFLRIVIRLQPNQPDAECRRTLEGRAYFGKYFSDRIQAAAAKFGRHFGERHLSIERLVQQFRLSDTKEILLAVTQGRIEQPATVRIHFDSDLEQREVLEILRIPADNEGNKPLCWLLLPL